MPDPTDAPWPDPTPGVPADPPPAATPSRASRTARAREQAEHLRIRADERLKQLEAQRPRNRWVDAGFSTFERDVTSGGGVLAAAVAFRIFIFMVPFVFVIVNAFPAAAEVADQDPTELAKQFGMAGLTASAIKTSADLSTLQRIVIVLVALFALVLASRSLIRVLRITHGLAWNTRVTKLRRPLRASLVLIGTVLGLVLFGTLTANLRQRIGLVGLLPLLLSGVVIAAMWTWVQWHLPRRATHWTQLVPGALLVGLGAEGLQLLTVLWFSRYIESKSETYGAIGAALAMLLWAYFLGRIVVSGAMLNAALWEQDQRRTADHAGSAPPGPEEHHDPRRAQRDEDLGHVELERRPVREQDQDQSRQQHRGDDSQGDPARDPRRRP